MAAQWADRLECWVIEFRAIPLSDHKSRLEHLIRTRRAFGGMGSLNDVSLPEADELRKALFESVNSLIAEITDK
jgi:hypothetical protein